MIDTIYFHWLKTGGLYDISTTTTKHEPSIIKCLYRNKYTFTVSRSKSKKGIEGSLWDIPQWSDDDDDNNSNDAIIEKRVDVVLRNTTTTTNNQTKRRLLVFNTHLDPWDSMNRKKQVNEILDFIDGTLRSIEEEIMMINNIVVDDDDDDDEETGQRQQQQQQIQHEWWSNTGVLIVGDFNIKAGSTEYYETLMSMSMSNNNNKNNNDDDSNRRRHHQCNWKDYFFGIEEGDNNNEKVINNNNNNDKSKHIHQHHTYSIQNSLVEYPNDCGRIDYIFGIQDFTTSPTAGSILNREYQKQQQHQEKKNMNSIISTSSSRTFMTLDRVTRSIRKEPIGAESSDHYALILDLIPRRIVS
jgi:endonuclease/exonuclease/phosphatase family metal-dependent hydrolase